MPVAIDAMRSAFSALAEGRAQVPMRTALSSADGVTLIMPGAMERDQGAALAVKVVSVFPGNKSLGVPSIHGIVLVVDSQTGRPSAIVDGAALTSVRTAAACGLATDLLSRQDSKVLAVIGSGVQARTQIEAVCCVRAIEEVRICNPNLESAQTAEALRDADIVCTASTSQTPVLADRDLAPGAHSNAIGSFQPHVRELPSATLARCLLVVDERQAAFEEAGDILQAIADGSIAESHIHCELGDLLLERAAGRTSDDQITLFKSVGVAVQDVAAAQAALAGAQRLGIGSEIAL